MEGFIEWFILLEILFFVVCAFIIIYLIGKRIGDKKHEHFGGRDN